jgi:hypothetical protein
LALIAAAQVASTDVSPDYAANVTMLTPLVGLAGLGLAAFVPPVGYVTGPLGAGLIALGPGAGAFVAGDPWRGTAIAAGGIAIPASAAFLISVGNFFIRPTTCVPNGNCDPAFPWVPLVVGTVGLAAELGYYTWAVGDARATAVRKNEERRSQQGAAIGH